MIAHGHGIIGLLPSIFESGRARQPMVLQRRLGACAARRGGHGVWRPRLAVTLEFAALGPSCALVAWCVIQTWLRACLLYDKHTQLWLTRLQLCALRCLMAMAAHLPSLLERLVNFGVPKAGACQTSCLLNTLVRSSGS